eukprot:TRINITY_DN103457_c0_g1_i1.p1 TRINITY_DN103457_c0_g1~~TRINITY_DN103457_c0_g1_i1.p1  ORF type:complete len:388 (+),score=34.15 TRINITY_DN103457_c0_g1_i1:56-1219(+)
MNIIVDTIPAVQDVIKDLLLEDEVAVGVEGAHLCRDGGISLILICPKTQMDQQATYLFDITTLKDAAFEYGLQDLLESKSVRKVIFDGRSANDALYHKWGFKMLNVYSLQVLHAFKFIDQAGKNDYIVSFRKCLELTGVVRDRAAQEAIINRGKNLYAPERGGSYEMWDVRPLHPDLVQYCAASVKHLLPVHNYWRDQALDHIVEQRGQERIAMAIESKTPAKGHQLSRRDFSLKVDTDEPGQLEIPADCAICMELLGKGEKESVEVRCLPCSHCFHVKCLNGYVRTQHEKKWKQEDVPPDFINYVLSWSQEATTNRQEPAGFSQWFQTASRCRVQCPLCRHHFPSGRALAPNRAQVDAAEPLRMSVVGDGTGASTHVPTQRRRGGY